MTLQLISNLKLLWRLMVSVSSQGWCDVRTSGARAGDGFCHHVKTTVQAWRAGVLLPQTLTNTTETVFYSRFGLFMFSGSVSDGECLVFWQVSESTKALRWIIDALKSQGCKSKMQPPLMSEQSAFISALIRCTVCILLDHDMYV